MKLLFISKKKKGVNWSDSIDLLREDLAALEGVELLGFEVDTGGLNNYLGNSKRLSEILNEQDFDVILVHHVICAWPLGKVIKKFRGTKVIALHETEPVLGFSYLLKNIFRLPLKHWIRFPGYWNSRPLHWFDQVWILSKKQALFKGSMEKYKQVNFLGVDEQRFQAKTDFGGNPKVFFPFGPERAEKGYSLAFESLNGLQAKPELILGGNFPFEKMPAVYKSCQVLLLLSLFETYSLVVLEAMASNLFLVVSKGIGLVEQLSNLYTKNELKDLGVYVVEREPSSICKALEEVLLRIEKEEIPKTRELLLREALDRKAVAKWVKNELIKSMEDE